MSFLNPFLLLGALGIALPILAHLLNKHEFKKTPWAAMQFLDRNVRVRSRQIKLRDLLLLALRCLALLLLVLAISKPAAKVADGLAAKLGERRAGVIIALDASYSMSHSDGTSTRFERAVRKAELIAESIHPGDPVCLVLLGSEHRVIVRNMAFDAGRFKEILLEQQPVPEPLDLQSLPRRLKELAEGMDAAQKEIHLITDLQEKDWKQGASRLRAEFQDLRKSAGLIVVPVPGDPTNLAITDLDLVSGVLRKGTVARYRATVRNFGDLPATGVIVKGLIDDINADTKTIPVIAAGASETVSLFIPFNNPGPAKITAELGDDALPLDNSRRTVAVIRDKVSVLCVEGSPGGADKAGDFIATALRARGGGTEEEDFSVETVPWVSLPTRDLADFDVVILTDVPAITPEQAKQFEGYVRAGNGLIWFPGEGTKAAVWNKEAASGESPLLPAEIDQTVSTGGALGMGRPLDPTIPDHPVCRPLLSLSEDLLSETQFLKIMQVKPSAAGNTILSLAGSDSPILLEHSLGRGQVFMFTTAAAPGWNNLALTPVFPMLLQQMVTYLTAREFEQPMLVGNSLSLSYVDQPDSSDAVFDTPSGETVTVPVRENRGQYEAVLDRALETGFYLARVSVQAPGMPIAVNLDTAESDVSCLPTTELAENFQGSGILIAGSNAELLDAIERTRTGTSYSRLFLLAGLALLLIESLLADRMLSKLAPAKKSSPGMAQTNTSLG